MAQRVHSNSGLRLFQAMNHPNQEDKDPMEVLPSWLAKLGNEQPGEDMLLGLVWLKVSI